MTFDDLIVLLQEAVRQDHEAGAATVEGMLGGLALASDCVEGMGFGLGVCVMSMVVLRHPEIAGEVSKFALGGGAEEIENARLVEVVDLLVAVAAAQRERSEQ